MGYLQLTPDLFYSMTYEELQVMAEGKREQEEARVVSEWEQTRNIAFRISQPYLKKKMTLRQFMPLPWDNKVNDKPLDMERVKELQAEVRAEIEKRKLKVA